MSRLDDMLARAHDLPVRGDEAARYVAELERWARPIAEPRRSWLPWFAGGFALAAAAAVILVVVLRTPPAPVAAGAMGIGDRVAVIAAPDTQYRVVAAGDDRTELLVDHGMVTARLWPGARPHRLVLRGAGVEAVATGTVFALAVDETGAHVLVHEGHVAVTRGDVQASVAAGTAWPERASYHDRSTGDQLLALPAPPPREAAPSPPVHEPAIVVDAGEPVAADAALARRVPTDAAPIADAVPVLALDERYRRARLLRGQGNFDAAITECLAIADVKDPTWSPLALLEAARIELGPHASPERTVVLIDRFTAEWPSHQLGAEAHELGCRALRQLGRGDGCAK